MPRGIYVRTKYVRPWNKGIKMPKGFGEKIGLAQKGKKKPWLSKIQKGRKLSEGWKRKIGKANIKRYKENPLLKIQIGNKLRGEKSPFWKGGTIKRTLSDRKYKEWRMAVFTRDDFTCQVCRKVGGYLEAHHIKSWVKFPELRFDTNNGITLCKECHNLTKGRQRKVLEGEIKEND